MPRYAATYPASVVSQVRNSPRHQASSAFNARPRVSSAAPPASGIAEDRQRIVERRLPPRGERVDGKDAAEQQAEYRGGEAAGDEQPRDRKALTHREADGGDHEPLTDVAEHVAEHQRHGDREQHRRVGLVARRAFPARG